VSAECWWCEQSLPDIERLPSGSTSQQLQPAASRTASRPAPTPTHAHAHAHAHAQCRRAKPRSSTVHGINYPPGIPVAISAFGKELRSVKILVPAERGEARHRAWKGRRGSQTGCGGLVK
jgi:hypothetical protein